MAVRSPGRAQRSMDGPRLWARRGCLCLVFGAAASVWATPIEGQTLRGRVLDAQDLRPLEDALVRVLAPDGEGVDGTVVDSTGAFRIALPMPGRYRVEVRQLGYETVVSEEIDAVDSAATYALDLRVPRAPVAIRGVEVSVDRANRRIAQMLGSNPAVLRIRPIRPEAVRDHAARGDDLSRLLEFGRIPNFQVLRSRQGDCYRFRQRGCMPVYLDGARMARVTPALLPLEMVHTIVVTLPNELIAFPDGGVHLYTVGWMR